MAANIENATFDDDVNEGTGTVVAVSGGFETSFFVDSAFFGRIIGQGGKTITRIRQETDTRIEIPRRDGADIRIFGRNRDDVASARQQIESIVLAAQQPRRSNESSSRAKSSPTDFTNVWIKNEEIKSNYERFMQEVLRGPPIEGLTEELFTQPFKLHITINVMTLFNDGDRARAKLLLEDCVERVIAPVKEQYGPIVANVRGVGVFRDSNPSKTAVLFGRIECEPLRQIADEIAEIFIAEGLSKRERDPPSVKLHTTLIKTNEVNGRTVVRHLPKTFFDATPILEKYADYEFGSQEVNEILLSSMREKDDDGYYQKIASIEF